MKIYYHLWYDHLVLRDSEGAFWADSAWNDGICRYITLAPKSALIYVGEL